MNATSTKVCSNHFLNASVEDLYLFIFIASVLSASKKIYNDSLVFHAKQFSKVDNRQPQRITQSVFIYPGHFNKDGKSYIFSSSKCSTTKYNSKIYLYFEINFHHLLNITLLGKFLLYMSELGKNKQTNKLVISRATSCNFCFGCP